MEKAQAESESRDVAIIAKAASDDWKAAAWRLERKQPRRYGPRVAVSVQQELDAVLDRLKKGLPPEWYEKVLELMAADIPGAGVGRWRRHRCLTACADWPGAGSSDGER